MKTITAKGLNGWTYEMWLSGGHLCFRRWGQGDEPTSERIQTIWLFAVEAFELPMHIRRSFFSYKTAGERVIKAAIQLCVDNQ